MDSVRFLRLCAIAALVGLMACSTLPGCTGYDPLDPAGNITIVWDIPNFTGDGYVANVRVFNYQFYRKVQDWQLSWSWYNGEYIWSALGAFAPVQGDCSKVSSPGGATPHTCLSNPFFRDLEPPTTGEPPLANCCKAGFIGCQAQEPDESLAAFQVTAGNASTSIYSFKPPGNFSIGLDGYSCTEPFRAEPTTTPDPGNPGTTRKIQAMMTYKVICTYSKEPVRTPPKCCVSLSAFYNDTMVPCPACSCACGNYGHKSVLCLNSNNPQAYDTPYLTTAGSDGMDLQNDPRAMECSPDGCPISVHFHIKTNYQAYWRGKVTVINRQVWTNYTDWNLVLEHPNIANLTDVFSFNAVTVQPYGVNNTAVFWGMVNYNTILHTAGPDGNVQSELLFEKTPDFTWSNGWAFPRKIYFNGEECAMPEEFPTLPNSAPKLGATAILSLAAILFALVF